MPRCGCATDCLCIIVPGECTTVVGSGTLATPYAIDVVIDPDPDNLLECGVAGLLVSPVEITIEDTPCIDLTGSGTPGSPLSADPIIAPDVCNLLECVGPPAPNVDQGLRVLLTTADTDCIDLEGCGTPGDPLNASPIISGDPGNVLECRATGMFAPAAAPASNVITPRATLGLTAGIFSIPPNPGSTLTSIVPIPWDIIVENVGGIATPPGFTVPPGGDGIYYVSVVTRDNPFSGNDSLSVPGFGFTFGVQLFLNGGPFPGNPAAGLTQSRVTKSSPQSIHLTASAYVPLVAGDTITSVASMHVAGGVGVPHVFLAGNMLQIARWGDAV